MDGFKLVLRLHTPVILPAVTPRLETLLREALCRCHQDWETAHELPIRHDEATGVPRGSQLIFGTTAAKPMQAVTTKFISKHSVEDMGMVVSPKRYVWESGPKKRKMSAYQAYLSPYLVFYGDGDAERCVKLIQMLDGVGRETSRGAGAFTVDRVEPDDSGGWVQRAFPPALAPDRLPFEPVNAMEVLTHGSEPVAVVRPERVTREVLT